MENESFALQSIEVDDFGKSSLPELYKNGIVGVLRKKVLLECTEGVMFRCHEASYSNTQ